MSFVTTQPEALAAAAGSLHGIGSAMSAPTKHVTCNSIARGDRCGNGPVRSTDHEIVSDQARVYSVVFTR